MYSLNRKCYNIFVRTTFLLKRLKHLLTIVKMFLSSSDLKFELFERVSMLKIQQSIIGSKHHVLFLKNWQEQMFAYLMFSFMTFSENNALIVHLLWNEISVFISVCHVLHDI